MSNLDFDTIFDNFVNNDSSAIKDIYNIIPTMSNEQLKILNTLNYYIEKYNLDDLRGFCNDFKSNIIKNKNLGFLNSFNVKSLLKAYTQDELIRGIKVNASTGGNNGGI